MGLQTRGGMPAAARDTVHPPVHSESSKSRVTEIEATFLEQWSVCVNILLFDRYSSTACFEINDCNNQLNNCAFIEQKTSPYKLIHVVYLFETSSIYVEIGFVDYYETVWIDQSYLFCRLLFSDSRLVWTTYQWKRVRERESQPIWKIVSARMWIDFVIQSPSVGYGFSVNFPGYDRQHFNSSDFFFGGGGGLAQLCWTVLENFKRYWFRRWVVL